MWLSLPLLQHKIKYQSTDKTADQSIAGRNLTSLFGTPRSSTISLATRRSNSFSNGVGNSAPGTPQSNRTSAAAANDSISRAADEEEERREVHRLQVVNKRTARRRKSLSCIGGGTGKGSTAIHNYLKMSHHQRIVLCRL